MNLDVFYLQVKRISWTMFTLPDQNFDCGISKSSALYFPCDVIIDIWNVCILHMCWFNQTSKQFSANISALSVKSNVSGIVSPEMELPYCKIYDISPVLT